MTPAERARVLQSLLAIADELDDDRLLGAVDTLARQRQAQRDAADAAGDGSRE